MLWFDQEAHRPESATVWLNLPLQFSEGMKIAFCMRLPKIEIQFLIAR